MLLNYTLNRQRVFLYCKKTKTNKQGQQKLLCIILMDYDRLIAVVKY